MTVLYMLCFRKDMYSLTFSVPFNRCINVPNDANVSDPRTR